MRYWAAEWEAGIKTWQQMEFPLNNSIELRTQTRFFSYGSKIKGTVQEIEIFFELFSEEARLLGEKIPLYKNKNSELQLGWKWEHVSDFVNNAKQEVIIAYEYRWIKYKENRFLSNANFIKRVKRQNKISKPGELKVHVDEAINYHIELEG